MSDKKCPDCGVSPGKFHRPGCDVERCPLCGGQAIGCGCEHEVSGYAAEVAKHGGPLAWTGEWPGDAECRELGWFCDKYTGAPRPAGHPHATEDLNRLASEARWDRSARRFVRRHAS